MGSMFGFGGARRGFVTTQWTRVIEAGQRGDRQALATLCQAYWPPIYGYLRARGFGPDQAEDFTQEVFEVVLSEKGLRTARRSGGRFRYWLRTLAMNRVYNLLKQGRTKKRGCGSTHVSIDTAAAEEDLRLPSQEGLTPEQLFDRCWAQMVVNRALARVRREYADAGREALFAHFETLLSGEDDGLTDRDLAEALGLSALYIRVDRCQMRKAVHIKFDRYLREEVGHTVGESRAVDDEMRILWQAFA